MFNNVVRDTIFTSSYANAAMRDINCASFDGDCTLLSTLRAMLFGKTKNFNANIMRCSSQRAKDADLDYDLVIIQILNYDDSSFDELSFDGYEEEKVVSIYYAKAFKTKAFINKELKRSVIITEPLSVKRLHYLQVCITRVLPWYFQGGISELEKALIVSLAKTDSDEYISCLNNMYSETSIRSNAIHSMLDNFENSFEVSEADRVRSSISDIIRKLDSYYEYISDCNVRLRQERLKLKSLEMTVSNNHELADFVASNSNIDVISYSNSRLIINIKGDIEYYDPEVAQIIASKRESYLFRLLDEGYKDYTEMLWRYIFVEQKAHIQTCATFSIDMGNMTVSALSRQTYGGGYENYIPNPHLYHYSCLGDNRADLNRLLREKDIVGVVENCIMATSNINMDDSTVMKEFSCDIWSFDNKKFIRLESGELVSSIELVTRLKEAQNGEEN